MKFWFSEITFFFFSNLWWKVGQNVSITIWLPWLVSRTMRIYEPIIWSHGKESSERIVWYFSCFFLLKGFFQARILEQTVISFSRWSSQPRVQIYVSWVSSTDRWILYQLSHQGSPFKVITDPQSLNGIWNDKVIRTFSRLMGVEFRTCWKWETQ